MAIVSVRSCVTSIGLKSIVYVAQNVAEGGQEVMCQHTAANTYNSKPCLFVFLYWKAAYLPL